MVDARDTWGLQVKENGNSKVDFDGFGAEIDVSSRGKHRLREALKYYPFLIS